MKVAIVGTGIAGLTAASLLRHRHEIQVFEAADYVGGHTHTVPVREGGRVLPVDTGFIVFNRPNYPNLCRLLDSLGVPSRDSDMSFSVHDEASGLEYNGTSLNALFAQRRNLARPRFWGMLTDILRFQREAPAALAHLDDRTSVAQFLRQRGYGDAFAALYLLPLGASLWSCDAGRFSRFPMRFVLEFLSNHRMLQVRDRPVWKTVVGGSQAYVQPLVAPFRERIRLATPVRRVRRQGGHVALTLDSGTERFDEVVLACHADQALALLADADDLERSVLACFPYQRNEVALHTDTRRLPRRPLAWASWNYRIPARGEGPVSVTYNMNKLQGLDAQRTYLVSLNPSDAIDPAQVLRRITYHHPLFTTDRDQAQAAHPALLRRRGVSLCGAYWGFGFHEDGVRSALSVGEAFDLGAETWGRAA